MGKGPRISVVVPSYNKRSILLRNLDALETQSLDSRMYEVIVVDDGSTDDTKQVAADMSYSYRYRYFYRHNEGASAARNFGVSMAEGSLIFFLDADIILSSDALSIHLEAQSDEHCVLVASRILPGIQSSIDPVDLLFQNHFDFGSESGRLHWRDLKTQALSVKRVHFFEIGPFDENLRRGQDIEFGCRAVQRGFEIRYCPQAVGTHNHQLDMRARCETERRNQRHLVAFFQKYPDLVNEMPHLVDKWPIRWSQDSVLLILRKIARRSLASRPALSTMHLLWKLLRRISAPERMLRSLYWKIVGSYQYLGLREGIEEYGL